MNTEVKRQEKLDITEKKTLERESYQESIWQRCCMGGMMENLKKNI